MIKMSYKICNKYKVEVKLTENQGQRLLMLNQAKEILIFTLNKKKNILKVQLLIKDYKILVKK